MYEIALTVAACRRAGTRVDVAWAVETEGFSSRDPSDAVALTPGGGRVGSLLSGALDDQLADVARQGRSRGRLIDVRVGDLEAAAAGLSCAGRAQCLVVPASELPDDLWPRLLDREPLCLVTRLQDDEATDTRLFTADTVEGAGDRASEMFRRATSSAAMTETGVVTIFWPVPRLVVLGGGAMADAVEQAAALLGWRTQVVADAPTAVGLMAGLAPLDKLIVLSHDVETAGPVLAAALEGDVGYIGALGSQRTQRTRADWLAYRGVTDVSRICGPAGLDIGASTPAEIAVSILAEALATQAGATGEPLGETSGHSAPVGNGSSPGTVE